MALIGEWQKIQPKGGKGPGARSAHCAAVIGRNLYCFGGEETANKPIDGKLYVYDFDKDTWSVVATNGNAPRSCLGARMVAVDDTLYLFGGRDQNNCLNDFYSYDTKINQWTVLATGTGPKARAFHSMDTDGENVYVFGGVNNVGPKAKHERFRTIHAYNIKEKTWSELPDPGETYEKREGAGFHVVNGKLWVVYGFASGDKGYESMHVQSYDPDLKKWNEEDSKGAIPSARSEFASAVVNNYIIIFGGETKPDPNAPQGSGTLSNESFALDTETMQWEKIGGGDEPGPRGWTASTTVMPENTKYEKYGLIMHGGKTPSVHRVDDLYIYIVNSA